MSITLTPAERDEAMDETTETPAAAPDRVLWLSELRDEMRVSGETVRRWRKDGKLPTPDVQLTRRSVGWRLSTLRAAGINLP